MTNATRQPPITGIAGRIAGIVSERGNPGIPRKLTIPPDNPYRRGKEGRSQNTNMWKTAEVDQGTTLPQ